MNKKAFTMIELLIVIVILGLLSTLVMPNIFQKTEKAKKDITCLKMSNVVNALNEFRNDNGTYPTTNEGLEILLKNTKLEKYKKYNENGYLVNKKEIKDAWNTKYIYLKTINGFKLISKGSDLKEGGNTQLEKDFEYKECNK